MHSREIQEQLLAINKRERENLNGDDLELEKLIGQKLQGFDESAPPILVVDDEAVYRNSIAGLLTNFRGGESAVARIPVLFARNAEEAVSLVRLKEPFHVIQDIDLGNGSRSGVEVIREFRALGFLGHICVHSNRFLFEVKRAATTAGSDSVLPKPMNRSHLFKLIHSALESKLLRSESERNIVPLLGASPRIAYIDDTLAFTMSCKMKLRGVIDSETFSSTFLFFSKVEQSQRYLESLDAVVTDYFFGGDDQYNGVSFAAELRKMGFKKPIYLASNGDFGESDVRSNFTAQLSKELSDSDIAVLKGCRVRDGADL